VKPSFCLVVIGLLGLLNPGRAGGAIIGGSVTGGSALTQGGTFVKLTPPIPNPFGPPNSVGTDNFQSPNLFGFDEQQLAVLLSPLAVDVGGSSLPANTAVASHYVFFDPGPTLNVLGTVNFDSDVLAIIASDTNLSSSDFLSNPGVNYLNPTLRGLEVGDAVTISGPRQIAVNVTAGSPGDYVRVLTAMPQPPRLAILPVGTNLVISWPTNTVGYRLLTSTNLVPPVSWWASTQVPVIFEQEFKVTNPVSSTSRFFRLANP